MVRGPQAIQKVWSCILLSLLACGGAAAQTPPTADLAPGPAWSNPRSLLAVGDRLYFVADDTERSGIWVLDLD